MFESPGNTVHAQDTTHEELQAGNTDAHMKRCEIIKEKRKNEKDTLDNPTLTTGKENNK